MPSRDPWRYPMVRVSATRLNCLPMYIVSLVIQGWTIGPAARLLGFRRAD